jgi:predicted lipid-binding transport protein (Tim44 family)
MFLNTRPCVWLSRYQTVKRAFIAVWRTPNEFWNKIIGPLVLGVIMGTLFLQMDNTQAGATQRSAVIFFSMLICDLLAMRTDSLSRSTLPAHCVVSLIVCT